MSIIHFEDVSKRYRLNTHGQSVFSSARNLLQRMTGGQIADEHVLWALRNVELSIEAGEMVGIIGRNGAGKSTMLKLLSKVAYPTSGRVETRGRLSAMIELGAGFHPDLSGRDNIFLSGAIQGLRKAEIARLVEPITEFAELQAFIDTPVKYYSSGMYARLGFAIVQQIESEILLIDEVLSVGDASFRRKCLDRMRQMHAEGRTIILVTHDTWSITSFCTRALMMHKGQVESDGTPNEVITRYRQFERDEWLIQNENAHESVSTELQIESIAYLTLEGEPTTEVDHDGMLIRVHYHAFKPVDEPVCVVRIRRLDGLVCCSIDTANIDMLTLPFIEGRGYFEARLPFLSLVSDMYVAEATIQHRRLPMILAREMGEVFRVKGKIVDASVNGVFIQKVFWSASVLENAPME